MKTEEKEFAKHCTQLKPLSKKALEKAIKERDEIKSKMLNRIKISRKYTKKELLDLKSCISIERGDYSYIKNTNTIDQIVQGIAENNYSLYVLLYLKSLEELQGFIACLKTGILLDEELELDVEVSKWRLRQGK